MLGGVGKEIGKKAESRAMDTASRAYGVVCVMGGNTPSTGVGDIGSGISTATAMGVGEGTVDDREGVGLELIDRGKMVPRR